ncbi:MAG: hypothetical protein ACI9ZM_001981 [Paracoccaceae bacterium]|jgi:hypothetical protein
MAFKYINLQLNFHNFIIIIEGINCNTNHITFDQIAEDFLNKIKKICLNGADFSKLLRFICPFIPNKFNYRSLLAKNASSVEYSAV